MKTLILAVVLVLAAKALTAQPASAQVEWTKAIDDTIEGTEVIYSSWYQHNASFLKIHTKATQTNDSIKAALYVQFGRGSSTDTTARALLDSIIAKGTKLFNTTAYGDRFRVITLGKNRNAEAGTANNLKVWVDRREFGR